MCAYVYFGSVVPQKNIKYICSKTKIVNISTENTRTQFLLMGNHTNILHYIFVCLPSVEMLPSCDILTSGQT